MQSGLTAHQKNLFLGGALGPAIGRFRWCVPTFVHAMWPWFTHRLDAAEMNEAFDLSRHGRVEQAKGSLGVDHPVPGRELRRGRRVGMGEAGGMDHDVDPGAGTG